MFGRTRCQRAVRVEALRGVGARLRGRSWWTVLVAPRRPVIEGDTKPMCGICGVCSQDAVDATAWLDRAVGEMRYRGPDACGRFEGANGAIAQARLAIIDLQTGDPPLTDESGSIGAVLNGEIYNFRTVRNQLLDDGHALSSQGDTEILAHLAEFHEPAEIARLLDGMFAFAIWDTCRQRLILGRDRMGKKPLYYWQGEGCLIFASEIKAVLSHPAVPRELNPRAIPAYLTFGYVPTPETFFEGVMSLPPGCVLTFGPEDRPRIERYWSLPVPGVDGVDVIDVGLDEAGGMIRAELTAAVERRLISDVPLGAFLSGGVDSSAVVALMAHLTGDRVKTFTIGFDDDQGFDERSYARLVARRYGTAHHECVVHPDAVELLETLLTHHDQPFGDSSAIPTYLLSQVTRQDVTVALSGDGADELFGGYERFVAALALERYQRLPLGLRRLIRAAVSVLPPDAFAHRAESAQRFARYSDRAPLDAYRSWVSFLDEDDWREADPGGDLWALSDYESVWGSSDGADLLARLLELNMRTYLLDDLLVKADRMSMANSLEVRSPFLDTKLVELAARLPSSLKVRRFQRKRVLTHSLRDLLPPEILGRRKRGFAVPLDRWFRDELQPYLEAHLGSPHARLRSHVNGESLDRLIVEHTSGSRNRGWALWMLLTLELFLRREGW